MGFDTLFRDATGNLPYSYQRRLANGDWPDLIDVPTGLGKTAAVALAWAYKLIKDPTTYRRLVWCLPMRVLVSQTELVVRGWLDAIAPDFTRAGLPAPKVRVLMGGYVDDSERNEPEIPTVIVGTQDMLLSRALMRGYGMSRYAWPMEFAQLHNDALWVFDETQAMGVAVETSAQLQAFREIFQTARPTHSVWMSATLGPQQLQTVDHPMTNPVRFGLSDAELQEAVVRRRVDAPKVLMKAVTTLDKKGSSYAKELADEVLSKHIEGTLTLVIVNRVARAQAVYQALRGMRPDQRTALLHSRFRPIDRTKQMEMLVDEGDRIIVSTQVIEAGVDVSARTMFSELAPWSSLVQRFGRCNRTGEPETHYVYWVDFKIEEDDDTCLPYSFDELVEARTGLGAVDSANPTSLKAFEVETRDPSPPRPVLRRRDLLELFDTTRDISGDDLDISPYVRDPSPPDVFLFWRHWEEEVPPADAPAAVAEELCRVSLGAASKFSGTLWSFDTVTRRWVKASSKQLVPGATYLVSLDDGGYEHELGFTGNKKSIPHEVIIAKDVPTESAIEDEPRSRGRYWMTLAEHTNHVVEELQTVLDGVDEHDPDWLIRAARWHDLGKAHDVFQRMLRGGERQDQIWAKSPDNSRSVTRKFFRHELASMLAFRQKFPDDKRGAFVVLAHHGKVRGLLRSMPGEDQPPDAERLFARGVWDGDCLPATDLGGGVLTDEMTLDLGPINMGEGSWTQTMLDLKEEFGIFRLGWWEFLLRCADQRASAKEQEAGDE